MIPRVTHSDRLGDTVKAARSNYSTKRSSVTALLLDGTKTVVLPVIKLEQLPCLPGDSASLNQTGSMPAAS